MNAECSPGEHPSLAVKTTLPVNCHKQEYNQDSPNANIWMYRDDCLALRRRDGDARAHDRDLQRRDR